MTWISKIPNRVGRALGAPFRWVGRRCFGFLCDRVFERADVDKSGFVEALELEICVLYVFSALNKRVPGWQDPPSRAKIHEAMAAFDYDGNKKLDKKEFQAFVKTLINTGPDAFFSRIGRSMAVSTAFVPAAASLVKRGASETPVGNMPLAVLAPMLGTFSQTIRSLLPF
ncbi:hypothetical protein FOA52_002383 [Chlamydomonas sp. UWO 241]|nr:hypothetical protein FOA52_002383 [Chlamydomonas sp. UWO 241]